ncbi:MAG: hypothetical protein ABI690_10645 [Chloroflexota bacterium]
MKYTSVLEVIDNFFGSKLPDFSALPEATIDEFGTEVRRFSETYEPPPIKEPDMFPSFLGGWPSARWGGYNPSVMTSLLYSGQVLVKDLLLDWFSDEQYQLPQTIPSKVMQGVMFRNQSGYKVLRSTPESRLATNRHFLSRTIPVIVQSRPLIEKGILVLAPTKKFEFQNQQSLEELATALLPNTIPSVRNFTAQFRPLDLPVSDDKRGMFLLWQTTNIPLMEGQIREQVREALYYFALEYRLAQYYGFTYTSTFPFEEYVCHNAVNPLMKKQSGQHLYQGVLTSKFPFYGGLTPDIIATIRDDDNFSEFRHELYDIYADVPSDLSGSEIRRHIKEKEEAKLRPTLDKLERSEAKKPLSSFGFSRIGVLRLAATVAIGLASPVGITLATGAGVLGEVFQRYAQREHEKGSIVIWKKLYNHSRTIKTEFGEPLPPNPDLKKPYWGIPLVDGLKVSMTEGMVDTVLPKEKSGQEKPG